MVIFFVLSDYLVSISLERSAGVLEFEQPRAQRIYLALVALCLKSMGVRGR